MPDQQVLYVVTAACGDEATRERYIRWLVDRHVAMVLATGLPVRAQVLRVDGPKAEGHGRANALSETEPRLVQTQYVFPSRALLEMYVHEHAPALRAEGLELFGTSVTFSRSVASIEATWPTLAG